MDGIFVVFFILVITILAAEGWFIWFLYPSDEYLSMPAFLFIEFAVVLCLLFCFFGFSGSFDRRFIFSAPFFPIFLYLLLTKIPEILEKKDEEQKLKQQISSILKSSGSMYSTVAFEKIGDLYFSKGDFKYALLWFEKARSVKETPEIVHKIRLAKQEILFQQKKLWICPECSATNSSNLKKCRVCGTVKPSFGSIREEFKKNLREIKSSMMIMLIGFIVVSFFLWVIRNSSFLTSFFFFFILFIPAAIHAFFKIFSK